jgi:hypothetical protein
MLRYSIYWILLLMICGYAFWRGRRDERTIAATCLAASVLSLATLSTLNSRYGQVEIGLLVVDLSTLGIFTAIALRSHRFWPLWVSGLQLTTTMGHVLKAMESDMVPIAYGAALRLWSYPILIILAIAVWRGQRMQFGRDRHSS